MYLDGYPICKMKNESYVQKHGVVTGELLYVRNIVIKRFFEDTLDDISDVLVDPAILAFIEELKGKVLDLLKEIDSIRNNLIISAVKMGVVTKERKTLAQFLGNLEKEKSIDGISKYKAFFLAVKTFFKIESV